MSVQQPSSTVRDVAHALAVHDLHFRYPKAPQSAINGISFAVGRGEVFGLLGPSGAGKSTLQRILVGLLTNWSGRVDVLGRPAQAWDGRLYDRIGVSFELPVGYTRLTAREDLQHFAHLHPGRRCRSIEDLSEGLGLIEAIDRPLGTLSKGMRVRVNIARALLHQPELLFLDEPTSGLDPVNTKRVRDLIAAEQNAGHTVVIMTHDMATATAVCDRVAFVVDGRIAACDKPRTLQLQHGTREVVVNFRKDGSARTVTIPIGDHHALNHLLSTADVDTVHSTEANLDEVFLAVTGRSL